MFSAKGQGGIIKTIFVGIILAVVLGMATSNIVESMGTSENHSLEIDGVGSQDIDLGNYQKVENANTTVDYDLSASDNISVQLNDTWIIENKNISGTGTIDNEVDSLIQTGTNTLTVELDNADHINSLTTSLDVSTSYDVLGVMDTAKSLGPTIVTFVFLGLLVLSIVGLIRYFRRI